MKKTKKAKVIEPREVGAGEALKPIVETDEEHGLDVVGREAMSKTQIQEVTREQLAGIMSGQPPKKPLLLLPDPENTAFPVKVVPVDLEYRSGGEVLVRGLRNDPQNLKKKERLAKKIVQEINPLLRKEVGGITFVALLRKPLVTLEKVWSGLREDKPVRLVNRVGCIFLEVGDETIQI